RFAVKIGANASSAATRKRNGTARDSTQLAGTKNASRRDATSTAYRRVGLLNETCLDTSTARRTLSKTPKNTSALTNHVVPKNSAKRTTFIVSNRRNAAPMKNRSVYRAIRRNGPPETRMSTNDARRIRPIVAR